MKLNRTLNSNVFSRVNGKEKKSVDFDKSSLQKKTEKDELVFKHPPPASLPLFCRMWQSPAGSNACQHSTFTRTDRRWAGFFTTFHFLTLVKAHTKKAIILPGIILGCISAE